MTDTDLYPCDACCGPTWHKLVNGKLICTQCDRATIPRGGKNNPPL